MWKTVIVVGVAFVLCTCGVVSAGLVEVGDISVALEQAPFYQGATGGDVGYFHLDGISVIQDNGILRVEGVASYDYGISGTVTVTRSDLLQDNSSGGQAEGDFAGGSIMTINGSLFAIGDSGNPLFTGDILVAQMVSSAWILEEPTTADITGNNNFVPTSGGLYDGIDLGNGDILSIGDLRADFSFTTQVAIFGADPASFGTTSHTGLSSNVQIVPVPEPCTVALLTLGGLCVLRFKRK